MGSSCSSVLSKAQLAFGKAHEQTDVPADCLVFHTSKGIYAHRHSHDDMVLAIVATDSVLQA